jgi:nitrite reductase/ring-hydroxylating ferredoxin subunit
LGLHAAKEVKDMEAPTLQRSVFQRILGICITKPPVDEGCWVFENGRIIVDLARATELSERNGAVRLEKKGLPERMLVIHGDDGKYHAFRNKCAHAKRRMDPVPGTRYVQCCSVGKSIFEYDGRRVSGSAKKNIQVYPVRIENKKLVISI